MYSGEAHTKNKKQKSFACQFRRTDLSPASFLWKSVIQKITKKTYKKKALNRFLFNLI
jgi:hypothetical protein